MAPSGMQWTGASMQAVDVFGKRDPLSEVADTVFRLAHTEGAQFDLLIQSLAVVARADDELQLS